MTTCACLYSSIRLFVIVGRTRRLDQIFKRLVAPARIVKPSFAAARLNRVAKKLSGSPQSPVQPHR